MQENVVNMQGRHNFRMLMGRLWKDVGGNLLWIATNCDFIDDMHSMLYRSC